MLRKVLIISILISFLHSVTAQDPVTYIRKYQDIAVAEMLRSGVPASIKLAQAILESNCGQSELACKANNHFGIKCGGNWNGKSFHKEDDDYANGKLMKSCFREFNSVLESYAAHSDFLADPAKATRYGSLFLLDEKDYKGWAQGLSKAGYATDPAYSKRLIDIIEKYELFRFDNEYEHELVDASPQAGIGRQIIKQANDVNYTLALAGDNPQTIAKRNSIHVNQLLRYNENIGNKNQSLSVGSRIYLETKKSSYRGKQKYHVLKEGEDIAYISGLYGVKQEALYKRNGLKKNEVPLPHQKILLKGRVKKALRTANPYEVPEGIKSGTLPAPPKHVPPPSAATDHAMASTGRTPGDASGAASAKDYVTHTVQKGDTLYGIARTYGMSVDELKKKNSLAVDTIFVGQKLVWK